MSAHLLHKRQETLREVKVADVVHPQLHLKAILGELLGAQSHDARIQDEQVEAGQAGCQLMRQIMDAPQVCQVQLLHRDAPLLGWQSTERRVCTG